VIIRRRECVRRADSTMSDTPARELDAHAALAALMARLAPIADHESAGIAAATGRVLANDVVAHIDVPAFANSAMDGYAMRSADCVGPVSLRLVGTALAGHGYENALQAGTAVRIMTGAPLPPTADAVVPQEDARCKDNVVSLAGAVSAGQYVRPRGEHVRAGEVVIRAGTTVHAPEIGLATVVGVGKVSVYRRLRVGLASTGDELVDPPVPLARAESYDGNRPLLAAACRAAGFDATDLGICADRADEFTRLLERARAQVLDALLVSGGSALGDADVVRKAQAIQFLTVNIRPGRGITVGTFGDAVASLALIGLPGNAVSTFVMFHLIALPALRHLAGSHARIPEHFPLPLAVDLACKRGCIEYRRGRLEHTAAGEVRVRPLERQGAGMLRTLAEADVLIAAGPEPRYRAGEHVLVVPLATLPR
jgi:molybdopterin molybdotransferase